MTELIHHCTGLCGEHHPSILTIIFSQPEVISSINYFKYVILQSKSKV
jgi:hypothetical protein